MALIEEKRIIVHLPNTTTAEIVEKQLREEIIEKIKEGVGVISANRQIVAVKKLKSGDLAVYIDNTMTKKKIKIIVD
jgi:hypothetical protein